MVLSYLKMMNDIDHNSI